MFNTPGTDEDTTNLPPLEGTTIFDSSGAKVGTLVGQAPESDTLIVQKGWLFTHDLYIPSSMVTGQDDQGIYLNLSKEDLKDERWKTPPAGGGAGMMTEQSRIPTGTPPVFPEPSMGAMGAPTMPGPLPPPVFPPAPPVGGSPLTGPGSRPADPQMNPRGNEQGLDPTDPRLNPRI